MEKPLGELCDIKHGIDFKSEFVADERRLRLADVRKLSTNPAAIAIVGRQAEMSTAGEIPDAISCSAEGDLLVCDDGTGGRTCSAARSGFRIDMFLHDQRLGFVDQEAGIAGRSSSSSMSSTRRRSGRRFTTAHRREVRTHHRRSIGAVVSSIPDSHCRATARSSPSSTHFDDETQRLESIYQRKLAALDALKKSLLHQAFSGQSVGPRHERSRNQSRAYRPRARGGGLGRRRRQPHPARISDHARPPRRPWAARQAAHRRLRAGLSQHQAGRRRGQGVG